MNVAEVAKMLRRPPEVIRDLIQNGRLVGQKMGDDWLVARDEVARFDKEEGGGRRDA
jgi:excisionase family DNA binding protein